MFVQMLQETGFFAGLKWGWFLQATQLALILQPGALPRPGCSGLGYTQSWEVAGKSFALGRKQRREACGGHGCRGRGMVGRGGGPGWDLPADQHRGSGAGKGPQAGGGLRGGGGSPGFALEKDSGRHLVKSFQKSLRLGQRREGGSHHLEGPRRQWGGRCGLRDQMEGWRGRGGLVGSLARRELELEVRRRRGWQSGRCLRGGHNRGGGRRREVGAWGQWPLRGLGGGAKRGLGWTWGNGGRGAGWWGYAQLVLDDKDARQSGRDLGWGARVQGGL